MMLALVNSGNLWFTKWVGKTSLKPIISISIMTSEQKMVISIWGTLMFSSTGDIG